MPDLPSFFQGGVARENVNQLLKGVYRAGVVAKYFNSNHLIESVLKEAGSDFHQDKSTTPAGMNLVI
jgi:hypothetical protein